MASIPPKNKQSVVLQPNDQPTALPTPIIQPITKQAAKMGRSPILTIFFMENSNPRVNMRKMTPMLLQVSIELRSRTVGTSEKWGPAKKPATI